MQLAFAGEVAKEHAYPEANEDFMVLAPAQGRIALSDGASESFDSKTWAALLTAGFVQQPALNRAWLAELIDVYQAEMAVQELSWSKQAALARGNFATLLGVTELPTDSLRITSVGDTLAVLLDGNEQIAVYPYSHAEQFQNRPALLSTHPGDNDFLFDADGELSTQYYQLWDLKPLSRPSLLVMTDALGEWALNQHEQGGLPWQILSGINDEQSFAAFVIEQRTDGKMRVDDTTLIRLEFPKRPVNELSQS